MPFESELVTRLDRDPAGSRSVVDIASHGSTVKILHGKALR